jgi:hypothetical protein
VPVHRPGPDDQVLIDTDLVVLDLRRVLENDRVDDRGLGLLDVGFALLFEGVDHWARGVVDFPPQEAEG